MSRTLRRPMFRGGRVSAYGTGIAAPLVPGYKGGGQIGGGIISGLPHADGRYGFQNPLITGTDLMSMNREQALKLAELYGPSSIDRSFYNTNSFKPYLPTKVTDEDITTETEIETPNIEATEGLGDYSLVEGAGEKDISFDLGLVETPEERDKRITTARLHKLSKKPWEPRGTVPIQTINNQDNREIKPEVDAKTLVAENKALFADLLGLDKARGQDISDMLLGFAGAEGDTTMEKFQKFAAAEAVRPGRRQKLEDAAGTLAIQDYIAGKRSKEQIQKLKEVEIFKLDEAVKRITPGPGDDWVDAVRKSAGKDGSYSSDATLKKALTGKFDGKIPINPSKSKKDIVDLKKDQDEFDIGFTIVIFKNGKKVIVERTETDIKIRTDLPVY